MFSKRRIVILALSFLVLLLNVCAVVSASEQPGGAVPGKAVDWQTISSGGDEAASVGFKLSGTIGQTAVGWSATTHRKNHAGFWQVFPVSDCCTDLRGNIDNDPQDIVSLGDLTALIDILFISLTNPECWEEANLDESRPEGPGSISLGDLTALIDVLFITLNPPPVCP